MSYAILTGLNQKMQNNNEALKKKYGTYLTLDEEPIREFKVGFYRAVTTSKRVIFLRKFPKAFRPSTYKNIVNVEHHVYPVWNMLFKSIILTSLSIYLYVEPEKSRSMTTAFFGFFEKNVPELKNLVSAIASHDVIGILSFLIPVFSVFYLSKFLLSFVGRLKVSMKGAPSVRITTSLTNDVKDLIKFLESVTDYSGSDIIPGLTGQVLDEAEAGKTYLFKEDRSAGARRLFFNTLKTGCFGLYITRTNPEQIKKELFEEVDFDSFDTHLSMKWLTNSLSGSNSVSPEPDILFANISDFIDKNKSSIVLLDGIEYLISHSNFDQILRFIQGIKDKIGLRKSCLILPVNPQTLSEKEVALLEREMSEVL